MSITNLTVPVPSDRVPEFYRWFADWVDGKPLSDGKMSGAAPAERELDTAVRWWNLLKPREREIFGLWAQAAPSMLTASEIIDKLDLNGPRDIPGILSWPGRKGEKAGFEVRWSFRYDPITEEPLYGIEDAEYAELIRRARATAEGK
jgi:hypothetical protein